ncbi:hypothetical protein EHI8A_080110 [Entamoeba histolytica HM-1:IMSS-B]|uniref:Uncharacterized protein n=6 Tax=Entamoeba histolytica TaxID=5759 RepID=C4M3Y0_ENTH1|nr:hypothetical protein EHI_200750 [Entamoeba histolytica HM-1:IMSS]EMD45004.1 Hypothetical protein EHI5A_120710 [Entamoeba histolytica KU27]EMH76544.1 hypothetical protein EHI8A_080110 [Entamoeba histolytica HM-1:IMSS-B]EMS12089.1 hypothetical protein KM1_144220 [Entamoeba histolytica HM-3:IMSS]ENY62956.1 hypothetical protein EHI7A_078790 [Entamoeba histolytica HM-1:IMSS-A]GAT96047.1 hypothetical protein CL6EHI_200750 [Entamoeba histolytica]|eukprot:XP_652676.1 hypothetical protein EHI_200750 [Entamoeba histolytica HM-1:IMSS]
MSVDPIVTSQDILGRTRASILTCTSDNVQSMKHSIYSFSTCQGKILQSTIETLFNKELPNNNVTLWIDEYGIKIVSEQKSVCQTIVFWEKDIFDSYIFDNNHNEFSVKIPLKELVLFFDSIISEVRFNVDIFILESNEILLQSKNNIITVRMKINPISDSICPANIFDFSKFRVLLYITSSYQPLIPSFGTMEWNHLYLIFDANIDGTLTISSSSISDSVSTHYSQNSFVKFECYQTFSARYRLSQFKCIRKALKHSKKITIMINQNKLLYIECSYQSEDKDVDAEIAFYVSAQVEDIPFPLLQEKSQSPTPSQIPTQIEEV